MIKTSFAKILSVFFLLNFSSSLLFALELYKSDAVVSYYAEKFHGKQTSNGEKYNMNDLTCASKSLPFGTVLKVTNLSNKKSVQVRVNDRGPFVSGRELDLSKAAATRIDMITSGTTHVKIEIVKMGEDTPLSRQTADAAKKLMEKKEVKDFVPVKEVSENKTTESVYEIQVAAFKDKENANQLAKKLLKQGFKDVVLRRKGEIYKVVIKEISQKNLPKIKNQLNENDYSDFVVKKVR